jgi:predicted dehydrogenase
MALNRRQFLQRSAAAGAGIGLPMVASSRVLGANEEILVGIVGCGGRGSYHIARMSSQPGVRVVALADADGKAREGQAKALEARVPGKVQRFVDMRKMFERKEIVAISNATMNYWHGLSTIWACQAGKHVYCEKPLSHFIWEGRQMVNAARKYNCLVQCGTQQRSRPATKEAIEWIRAGNLGKILYITCFANKPRVSCGKRTTPLPIPDYVDYDLWCGPARKEPVYRDRLQYDCSFTWNMGDGESCNQGVHEIDVARWLLGETALPRRVMSIGGRFVFNDACEVPNTQIIYYDFPSVPVLYEVHNLRAAKGSKKVPTFRGHVTGSVVDCEGGSVAIDQGSSTARDKGGKLIKSWSTDETHFQNFIHAVRSGKREDLNCDVLEGHLSTAITHAGNISYRLGKPAPVAKQREQVRDVPLFSAMYDRYLEHLKAHEIDPDTSTLGPWLECDPEHECFKDNAEANKLVRGFYRPPYVVPEIPA